MSQWLCCCSDSSSDAAGKRRSSTAGHDYLLPGSEWDTSSSGSSSFLSSFRGSKKSNRGRGSGNKRPPVTHSEVGLDSPSGDYQPPVVPPSQKLPTFEEFRLLKTVGRGAFGKVCGSRYKSVTDNFEVREREREREK